MLNVQSKPLNESPDDGSIRILFEFMTGPEQNEGENVIKIIFLNHYPYSFIKSK